MEKNNDSFLKTMIIIAVVAVVCLVSFLVSLHAGSSEGSSSTGSSIMDASSIIEKAQNESNSVKDSEMKELSDIDVERYLEMYTGNEDKVILVARPTCSYCQIAEPIIRNIAYKYNIDIYYLNTDEFSADDESKFIQSDEVFSGGYGTPMLLVVSGDKIVDKVDGLADMSRYIEFFKRNNIIGE